MPPRKVTVQRYIACYLFSTHAGKYVYIETSKRKPKDKAVLHFKGYSGGTACLSFYYHMYGRDINRLIVKLGGSKIFAKKKDQGNNWKRAKVTINHRGTVCS